MTRVFIVLLALTLGAEVFAEGLPQVRLATNYGDIVLELDEEKAPVTVRNFLRYVDEKSYDGIIFHRVIPGFMIQTGGHRPDMSEAPTHETILNEADNGLKNLRGTIAMARTNEIDSAGRQFFINVENNGFLDNRPDSCTREDKAKALEQRKKGMFRPQTCKSFGYAVFGRVIEGMETVSRIEMVETKSVGPHGDVPVTPVFIKTATRVEQ